MNLSEKQVVNIVKAIRRYGDVCAKDAKKQKTVKILFRPSVSDFSQLFKEQLEQLEITIACRERAEAYSYIADAIMNIATGEWKEMPK